MADGFRILAGILYCFLAFEPLASIQNSRFQQGFYNVFWLSNRLQAYRIRVFSRDSIVFLGFRIVCKHTEFAFSLCSGALNSHLAAIP